MKELKLDIGGKEYTVGIEEFDSSKAVISVDGKKYTVGLKDLGEELKIETVQKAVLSQPGQVKSGQQSASSPSTTAFNSSGGSHEVAAPLPGLVLNILVKTGDSVKSGQKIMTIEAMKMENDINATREGKIKSINVKNGDNISEGDVLAVIE